MTARRSLLALGSLVAPAALLPGVALACPVCFSGKANVLPVYVGTAALLTVLPFLLLGGIFLWFRRQARARASRG